jgi:tRNA splicing ligase
LQSYTVHYRFSQRFSVPAKDAFAWAIDYDTEDINLMGLNGKRDIERIDKYTLILDDTFFAGGRTTKKRRLIRLFPELLVLTNTRLSGPNRYSQFLYQFVDEGKGKSRLDFSGAQVNSSKTRPTPSRIAALGREYARADSALWFNLAEAMERDLGARR